MLYLSGLKNVVADFLSRHSLPEPTGNVAAAAAADPVDFEAMAAEQNSCAETQRLLGGTSLKLAFHQAGAHRLAGDVSTDAFHPIVPQKFRRDNFSSQEACLPSPCLFQIHLARSVQRHHCVDAILPLLPAGQDSPPCLTSAFADPHAATLFLSHSH
jgi:hypothetical protein